MAHSSVVFLPKSHNHSLFIRKTLDKSLMRDSLQNNWPVVLKMTGHQTKKIWESVTTKKSLRRCDLNLQIVWRDSIESYHKTITQSPLSLSFFTMIYLAGFKIKILFKFNKKPKKKVNFRMSLLSGRRDAATRREMIGLTGQKHEVRPVEIFFPSDAYGMVSNLHRNRHHGWGGCSYSTGRAMVERIINPRINLRGTKILNLWKDGKENPFS